MAGYGRQFGLLSELEYQAVMRKYERIEEEVAHLRKTVIHPGSALDRQLRERKLAPVHRPTPLSTILKRPEISYRDIAAFDGALKDFPQAVIDQVEYEIKYEGFIARQLKDVEKFRYIENIRIPESIDYDKIPSLSVEIRQKLKRHGPVNLGQANRISGVTPAAISILMVYLRKLSHKRAENP
jgi:tRNA uridine 5-carboxymethylaminomethyl modification enzyme